MERTASTKDKLSRRLASLKVAVDLLNHELDGGKAEKAISFERPRLEALVTTMEMFIEDVEDSLKGSRRGEDKVERTRASAS